MLCLHVKSCTKAGHVFLLRATAQLLSASVWVFEHSYGVSQGMSGLYYYIELWHGKAHCPLLDAHLCCSRLCGALVVAQDGLSGLRGYSGAGRHRRLGGLWLLGLGCGLWAASPRHTSRQEHLHIAAAAQLPPNLWCRRVLRTQKEDKDKCPRPQGQRCADCRPTACRLLRSGWRVGLNSVSDSILASSPEADMPRRSAGGCPAGCSPWPSTWAWRRG